MPTQAEVIELLRQFKRSSRLLVYRTITPTSGDDYFVQRLGGPDGGSVNGIEISKLRVKFSIERDLSKNPNKCNVEIYNLAPKTRSAMETKPLSVELSAGHADVNRLLFTGDIIFAMSKQEGPNWVTELQVGDNARAFANARVSKTYKRGTSLKQVLRDVAKKFGATLPNSVEVSSDFDIQLGTSLTTHGAAKDELTKLLAPYGMDWSFQNGKLQILKYAESRNDVYVVSEKTGMIGTPDCGQPTRSGKPPTIKVKMLLRPELMPGGLIELKSTAKNGFFKLTKVKHSGDTHDTEWFTEVEVKPASGPPGSANTGFSGGSSRGSGAGSSF